MTRRWVEYMWGTAITLDVRDDAKRDDVECVFTWFRRVDALFSTWRSDSEISRLGRRDLRLDQVSPEVRAVLEICDRVNEESRGAFDIYFGADPRVAWREGFGPIDPSGLVKGWALERASEMLRANLIDNFAINAGGDVIAAGQPEPGSPWHVGLQHPWQRDKVAMVLALTDRGVATSGRYERGDHIIDPRTGRPARQLMAVSVVADDLALADGYATTALALGDDGPEWLAEHSLAALTIANDATVTVTSALEPYRA